MPCTSMRETTDKCAQYKVDLSREREGKKEQNTYTHDKTLYNDESILMYICHEMAIPLSFQQKEYAVNGDC